MFHIVLYEPEIPPNTGNIIRLCANTGAKLHLIHPLGFFLTEKNLKRAGLDYHALTSVEQHESFKHFLKYLTTPTPRLFACTTKGQQNYVNVQYKADDVFIFGPETRGLPQSILDTFSAENKIRIPMQKASRSLNLSNSVAVILYEAWRQIGFVSA
jgi:tRNA (cytidine/uridine-2'-O-)-methyltransferase